MTWFKKVKIGFLCTCILIFGHNTKVQAQSTCLYKNPLCFYNTDVLSYLQTLHKNQQFQKMTVFFYGPVKDENHKQLFVDKISNTNFGYTLKRVGIKEITKTQWSLTYQRTILGTNETFKVDCALIHDTCRVYLDKISWQIIFK